VVRGRDAALAAVRREYAAEEATVARACAASSAEHERALQAAHGATAELEARLRAAKRIGLELREELDRRAECAAGESARLRAVESALEEARLAKRSREEQRQRKTFALKKSLAASLSVEDALAQNEAATAALEAGMARSAARYAPLPPSRLRGRSVISGDEDGCSVSPLSDRELCLQQALVGAL